MPSFSFFKIPLWVLVGAVFLLSGWWFGQRSVTTRSLQAVPDRSVMEWQLEGRTLSVEVVNTPESISQGLGGRDQLETDGMLFVFPRPTRTGFWMKDMRFPIDIIWIQDGRVVGVERNVQPPPPGTADTQLEIIVAPQEVDMVLETLPGWLE